MGMTYASIELLNGDDMALNRRNIIGEDEIQQMTVEMLVDSGALMLVINESIRQALGLSIIDHRTSYMADGSLIHLPVAGTVVVRFMGRFCTTNALVLPGDGEPLLGAIPLEELDLWWQPARGVLTPIHPEGQMMALK